MMVNMILAALFVGVGLALIVLTGWFGILLGAVSLLIGLVLALRGYRQLRGARA
jgi:hypothetical protein